MSFKKGDRVRIVRSMGDWDALSEEFIGAEGTVSGLASGPEWDYEVQMDSAAGPVAYIDLSVYAGEIEAA